MRYLTVNERLEIYSHVMQQTGGATGIRDEVDATTAEQVITVLQVASSQMERESFTNWLCTHIKSKP